VVDVLRHSRAPSAHVGGHPPAALSRPRVPAGEKTLTAAPAGIEQIVIRSFPN